MKKAFLLTEAIIAITLIFGVVFALFKVKENSLHLLQRVNSNDVLNSAISIVALNNKEISNENDNIYLKDVLNFEEEQLKKSFKNIKVKLKEEEDNTQNIEFSNSSIQVTVMKTSLKIDDEFKKNIYTVKFE